MFVRMWLTCRCTRMPISSYARLTLFLTAISVVSGIWPILRAISSTVVLEIVARHHLVEQSPLQRLLRGKRRGEQQPVHRAVPVHQQPRLDHGVAAGFSEALRQRHLEVRVLGRDAEVGQQTRGRSRRPCSSRGSARWSASGTPTDTASATGTGRRFPCRGLRRCRRNPGRGSRRDPSVRRDRRRIPCRWP